MNLLWLLALSLVGLVAASCKPDTTTSIAIEKYKGLIIGLSIVLILAIVICLWSVIIMQQINEKITIPYEDLSMNLTRAIIIAIFFFFPLFFTPSAVWGTLVKSIYWKDVNVSVSNVTLAEGVYCCAGGNKCKRICVDTCKIVTLTVDITVKVTSNRTEVCTYQYSRQCGPDIDEISSCVNSTINSLRSTGLRADPNNYRRLSKDYRWTAEKILYLVGAGIAGTVLVVSLVMAIIVSILICYKRVRS